MIRDILKTLSFVVSLIVAIVFTVAVLYISLWVVVGMFILGVSMFVFSALRAKRT